MAPKQGTNDHAVGQSTSTKPWWRKLHAKGKAGINGHSMVWIFAGDWLGPVPMPQSTPGKPDKRGIRNPRKKTTPDRLILDTAPRHPRFDEFWATHHKMIFKMAHHLAKTYRQRPEDLLGSLVLRFNHCLHYFDEARGGFSTLFYARVRRWIWANWLRWESEKTSLAFWKLTPHEKGDDVQVSNREFAFHEADYHLYRVPDHDKDWTDEIVGSFDSADDCWRFMTRGLDRRAAGILESRYRLDMTLEDIGRELGITKERVRHLLEKAMPTVREKLMEVEDFNRLFV